jgi:polysaccharide biosynthesis protein PslH
MKKKILFITKFVPAPAYGGGLKRNFAWIKFLSKYYKVDVIGYWNKDFGNSKIKELKKYTNNIYGYPFVRTKKTLIKNTLDSFISKEPIINLQYYNKEIANKINQLCTDNQYDFVFFAEIATVQYKKLINNIPFYFDDHNVEYELIKRTSEYETFPMNIMLKRESRLMKNVEIQALSESKSNFFVSERDLKAFSCSKKIKKKSFVVNNTYANMRNDLAKYSNSPTLIFVGSLSWKPNKHGLIHFIKNIYTKLYLNNPSIKFNIVGSAINSDIKEYDGKMNIKIYENAEEKLKNKLIDESWICVVPVYFGSGTRIKILEYWSHSKTVVSTKLGAEGLPSVKGTFIVDDDAEIINSIQKLLSNPTRLKKLGEYNYRIFKEKYEEENVYGDTLYSTVFTK